MAEFNIKKQNAHLIRQAEVINNQASWNDMADRLRMLLPEVERLAAVGKLDGPVGVDLHCAISEAAIAEDKKSRIKALTRASNIAMGVSILSGISQTIAEMMQLLSR